MLNECGDFVFFDLHTQTSCSCVGPIPSEARFSMHIVVLMLMSMLMIHTSLHAFFCLAFCLEIFFMHCNAECFRC